MRAFETRDALMRAAADALAAHAEAALAARGEACLALSGGSTPAPAYERLAVSALDWARVTFILVDERFVPPSHPASNEGMLRRTLAPALAAGARLLPLYAADASLEEAAARADALYAPLRIDAALMGMGEDGHAASWFPGAPGLEDALDPASKRTVIAQRAPGAAGAAERLTLTRAAIARAGAVLLLIAGKEKRARLEQALRQALEQAPVAALFRTGPEPQVLWAP